jgi:hypothetical protein
LPEIKQNLEEEVKKVTEMLENALQDKEKQRKVDEILERFSTIKREDFINRYTSIARYIEQICGKGTHYTLFRILSKSIPEVDEVLKEIKDENVRDWLRQLNAKYIAVYEGFFPPLPNDWYRILWTTKVDFTHGNVPLIETTILKRNGQSVFLEMPFPAMANLVNQLLKQICQTKEIDISQIPEMRRELEKTKEIVEAACKTEVTPKID